MKSKTMCEYREEGKYSMDRLSICMELAEGLRVRGIQPPADWAGPDMISVIMKTIDNMQARIPLKNI